MRARRLSADLRLSWVLSCLAVPVFEVPEGAIPAAQCRPELLGQCRHLWAAHNRDDHPVFHDHIVHGNEESRPLDSIKFTFRPHERGCRTLRGASGWHYYASICFPWPQFLMTGIVARTPQGREVNRHPTYTSRYLHRTYGRYQDLPHRTKNKPMALPTRVPSRYLPLASLLDDGLHFLARCIVRGLE